jgi:Putative neutral zinc metallopeptidase
LTQLASGQQVSNGSPAQQCRTGADTNRNHDCAVVAMINSIQDYWTDQFARSAKTYRKATTNFFNGGVRTGGCGSATSDIGPFYCPADATVHIDLSFSRNSSNVSARSTATTSRTCWVRPRTSAAELAGPTSGSVRLQAERRCRFQQRGRTGAVVIDTRAVAAGPGLRDHIVRGPLFLELAQVQRHRLAITRRHLGPRGLCDAIGGNRSSAGSPKVPLRSPSVLF